MTTELLHWGCVSDLDTTYFVASLTPGHSSACCGQYPAKISNVLRPSSRAKGGLICSAMTLPAASSKYGKVQPPYWKPPDVSSSGPPGACMTPSRLMNDRTMILRMML